MSRRRALATADPLALALLLGAVMLFFAPVWARGRVFESDGQLAAFFDPVTAWSDRWIGGWPVLADPASYALYPVRLVLRAAGSFNAFVMAGYAIAAAGLYAYLRLLGLAIAAAALGALGFAFSGFLLGHLAHTTMVHTAAWLTPALAGIEATLARGDRRAALATAAAVGLLCLAGHSQLVAYALVQLGIYLACRLAWSYRVGRVLAWGLAVAGVALGTALAAPALVLTIAYLPETPRKALTYARFAASAALPIEQLPSFFFPFLYGGGSPPYTAVYFGKWTFAGVCTYVPSIVLLLAAAGVAAGPMRLGVVWAVIGGVAALLTVGDGIPWLAEAVYGLPGLGLFRAQGRHAFEVDLALATLAAFGFDALLRGQRPRTWLLPVAIVVAGFASTFAWVARHYRSIAVLADFNRQLTIPAWNANPAVWVPAGHAVLALVAFAIAASRLPRWSKGLAVFAILGIETIGFGWHAPWVSSAQPQAALAPSLMERLVMEEMAAKPGRIVNVQGALGRVLTPERSRLFGLSALNWYGPLAPEPAATLIRASPFGAVQSWAAEPSNLVLDLYGVRYLIMDSLVDDYHYALTDRGRWRLVARGDGSVVHENLHARPLAWLVGEWERLSDADAFSLLGGTIGAVGPPFDVGEKALVAELASERIAGFDPGRVAPRWRGAASLEVTTESRSGGLLVIGVNHLPGWTATIDGEAAALERADYALLAVRVPAGRHLVRLRYASPGLAVGIGIALAGLGAFAWLAPRRV